MNSVPPWEWATIAACVLLSGYFSGSETAFVSLSRAKVQSLVSLRGRRHPVAIWLKDPSALLTAILIGNNLSNIGASALATDIASAVFANQGIAVAVGVMTLVILVFGEITPKVMARRYAEKLVLSAAYPLALFYYLTWPATRFFTWVTRLLIRLTGQDPSRDFTTTSAEELEILVAMSASEGGIERYPAHLIDRIFKFRNRTVKDAMVPRTDLVAVEISESVNTLFGAARASGHSRLPVYRESMDEIVGIFHVKDLLVAGKGDWDRFRLAEHLHPPYYVPESAPLVAALREFQKRHIHLAVVVDEFGGTEGIITLEDILEELVGEILDEFDRDVVTIKRLPSGAFEVSGRAPIDDLKKVFTDWIPEVPSKTVGGLIMEMTGRVPSPGETVASSGLKFTVVGSDERQIKRVRVEPMGPSGGQNEG